MYIDEFKESTEKARRNQSATKILNELNTQRKSMNPLTARRWVWELIQNAKDVAYENQKIKIEINHKDSELQFKHNGKYFSVDNVISLIEQVSSKERHEEIRQEKNVTGKFGTGFLSTHLLSEMVAVEGVVELSQRGLNRFSIVLDRTGKTINEINDGIDRCHQELKETYNPNNHIEDLNIENFNTVFRYHLSKNGEETAKEGINELHRSAVYTLAFVPSIKSIHVESTNVTYSIADEIVQLKDHIKMVKVNKYINGVCEVCNIVVATNDETSVAIEVNNVKDKVHLRRLNDKTPRIFCDFPLIGTEKFPFPAVVNNASFDLNEPRDDIFLSTSDDKDVLENKKILETAVELFKDIVNLSVEKNWSKQYFFAESPDVTEKRGFDSEWFDKKVITPIREHLLHTPIIETSDGERKAILTNENKPGVWFPANPNGELRLRIWECMNNSKTCFLPNRDDIDIWYNIKWIKHGKLTLKVVLNSVQNLKSIDRLNDVLRDGIGVIQWMNDFFKLVSEDRSLVNEIANSQYKIIPNQYGEFEEKRGIWLDTGISEILKDVLIHFEVDIRKNLKHSDIKIEKIEFSEKTQNNIIEQLNKKIRNSLVPSEQKNVVCESLVHIIPAAGISDSQKSLVDFSKNIFRDSEVKTCVINNWNEKVIEDATEYHLERLIKEISSHLNISDFSLRLGYEDIEETKLWFYKFIDYIIVSENRNMLDNSSYPILPDQNGNFCCESEVFEDDGDIDEELKDICNSFGFDFRENLLIKEISLELPDGRVKNEEDIAELISKYVNNLKDIRPRDEDVKNAFKELLLWFYDNETKSEELFANIHENIYWLYDDKEVAENIKRSKEITDVMDELGINDIEELKMRLKIQEVQEKPVNKETLTNEILASLGITSLEEYEALLKDEGFMEKYHHTSTPNYEYLKYSQKINKRAMEKVIEYLDNHPDYNLEEREMHAPTTIGGIYKKNNEDPIYVVVRPSDSGKVLIYHASEKDSLEQSTSELWIQNGEDVPSLLTLGKILKVTGINKIPIY